MTDKDNILPAIEYSRFVRGNLLLEHLNFLCIGLGRREDFTSGNILSRFRRYEGQIEQSLYRTLAELDRHKWLRQKNNLIPNEPE